MIGFGCNNDDNNDSFNESEEHSEPPEFSTLVFNGYSEAIEEFHKFSATTTDHYPGQIVTLHTINCKKYNFQNTTKYCFQRFLFSILQRKKQKLSL